MTKEMVCIICPIGCHLTIEYDENNKPINVTGNSCPRGAAYAMKECTSPERILTTTIRVNNGTSPLVSVKSSTPLPKAKLLVAMQIINQLNVEAPINIGDVLIKNILDLNVDIIATSQIKKALD